MNVDSQNSYPINCVLFPRFAYDDAEFPVWIIDRSSGLTQIVTLGQVTAERIHLEGTEVNE